LNRVQVVPLAGNVERLYPSEACVTLGGERRKAMTDQLTTASKQRLTQHIGAISAAHIEEVERAVQVQLGME
jgi:mRNA interferase MazF